MVLDKEKGGSRQGCQMVSMKVRAKSPGQCLLAEKMTKLLPNHIRNENLFFCSLDCKIINLAALVEGKAALTVRTLFWPFFTASLVAVPLSPSHGRGNRNRKNKWPFRIFLKRGAKK